jgi:hypothetical protein
MKGFLKITLEIIDRQIYSPQTSTVFDGDKASNAKHLLS